MTDSVVSSYGAASDDAASKGRSAEKLDGTASAVGGTEDRGTAPESLLERVTKERDLAREECGHEKAMRASITKELYVHVRLKMAADAELEAAKRSAVDIHNKNHELSHMVMEADTRRAVAEAELADIHNRIEALCDAPGVIWPGEDDDFDVIEYVEVDDLRALLPASEPPTEEPAEQPVEPEGDR